MRCRIVEYINLHDFPSGERDNAYLVFLSVLSLAGQRSHDVTEYISHHFETSNEAVLLSVCSAYIYVYFHVMTDIYFRELLKSIIPLSLIGRRSNIYTLVF